MLAASTESSEHFANAAEPSMSISTRNLNLWWKLFGLPMMAMLPSSLRRRRRRGRRGLLGVEGARVLPDSDDSPLRGGVHREPELRDELPGGDDARRVETAVAVGDVDVEGGARRRRGEGAVLHLVVEKGVGRARDALP